MHCVAPTTCKRKPIIAEVMFLDSSKMGGKKPHAQPSGSGLFFVFNQNGAYVYKLNPIYALLHWNYEK